MKFSKKEESCPQNVLGTKASRSSEEGLAAKRMGAAIKLSESTWALPEKADEQQRSGKKTSSFQPDDHSDSLIHNITQKQAIPFFSADAKEVGIKFGKDKDYIDHSDQQPYLSLHHGQAAHLYFNWKF